MKVTSDETPEERRARLINTMLVQPSTVLLPDEWLVSYREDVERPRETPTSIRTFLGCQLRWFLTYYSDLGEQELTGEDLSFPQVSGSMFHRVLEVFYSEPRSLRTPELLKRTFHSAWDAIKQRSESGIIPEWLQAEFNLLEGVQADVERFRSGFYSRCRTLMERTLEVEPDPSEVKIIANEARLGMEWNGIYIRGRIDRIVGEEGGVETLDDWKTGADPNIPDENIHLLQDDFIPMGLYALMRSRQDSVDLEEPGHLVRLVRVIYLGGPAVYGIKINQDALDDVMALLNDTTRAMLDLATDGEIGMNPQSVPDEEHEGEVLPAGNCAYCPAAGICPAWQSPDVADPWSQLRSTLEV